MWNPTSSDQFLQYIAAAELLMGAWSRVVEVTAVMYGAILKDSLPQCFILVPFFRALESRDARMHE